MHTFWIIVGVLAVLIVLAILLKSNACSCCGDCDCCCDCGECCTVSSLPMFILGVVALWGGGLTAIGLLVYSVIRS